jgi:uncharacterized protein
MINPELLEKITVSLRQPDIEKVILFGSYANGMPGEESDLDLLVITADKEIPQSHKEKTIMYLRVNDYIGKFRTIIPIDLLVFSNGMFRKFKEMNSMFAQEILNNGVVLYEKPDQGMA